MVIVGAIETWEGATLAVGRVDAGLGRCGQVVAAVLVVGPGPFVVEGTLPISIFVMLPFIGHGDVVKETVRMIDRC